MKYARHFTIILLLIAAVIFSGCIGIDQAKTGTFKNITVQEAAELIKANQGNPGFSILDVRTPDEFNEGHIEGALNLDFYAASFKDDLDKLDKTKTYFVYCRSGNRSGQAMKMMETMGFKEVYNLSGGMVDWIAAGLPAVK